MSDELFSVAGQIVLVTGGSRGIGKAIAGGFVSRGATVVICSRNLESVDATVRELSRDGGSISGLACDVANSEDVTSTVQKTLQQHGRIDTLLNVAGVNRRKRAEQVTADDYRFIMDTNLKGAFEMCQEVGRHMIERKSGVQINVESLNTYMPLKGVLPYAISKFGMLGMTRGLALEWGQHGIRVNSLAPGFILTDLTEKLWSDPTMQDWNRAQCSAGTSGSSRRHGRYCHLSGFKGVGVHDRSDAVRRRRIQQRLELADSAGLTVQSPAPDTRPPDACPTGPLAVAVPNSTVTDLTNRHARSR
ncbi:MAG: SDR family NAD(P)-dependent oxidoreductase [Planctomycetaceae bacterium]